MSRVQVAYWRTASPTLPSARCIPIIARWADSRSGSARTAARPASSASREAALGGQALTHPLERVQADLAEALALDLGPLVVPVGQQVLRVAQPGHELGPDRAGAGEHLLRGHGDGVEVDLDPLGEPELTAVRPDDVARHPVEPPQRRAQACRRPLLGRLEPERAGHVHSRERAAPEAHEGDEAAGARRQRDADALALQLERSHQGQTCARVHAIRCTPQSGRGSTDL